MDYTTPQLVMAAQVLTALNIFYGTCDGGYVRRRENEQWTKTGVRAFNFLNITYK